MKLNAQQLAQQLKQSLLPVYLVSGDEILLVEESIDIIRQSCREHGFSEREIFNAAVGFNWKDFINSSHEISLFADRKIIELRIPNGKPGNEGAKAIQHYLENPSEDNILIIITNKLDRQATRSKWFKAVDAVGATLALYSIDSRDLPRWLEQRLQKQQLSIEPAALQALTERTEGNLLAAVQEVEKLKLAITGKHINLDDVLGSVGDNARFDVFNLIDQILAGKPQHSLKILSGLKAEGNAPSVVLWAISRELRQLYKLLMQLQTGRNIDQVMQQNRIWKSRQSITRMALQRLNPPLLEQLIQIANRTDNIIKGQEPGDAWETMAQLTVLFSGKRAMAKSNLLNC